MNITTIRKRDGRTEQFDVTKIENAVAKAFLASGEVEAREVSTISRAIGLLIIGGLQNERRSASRVTNVDSVLDPGMLQWNPEDEIPSVEGIQDRVEQVLMQAGYPRTAKQYILYRSQHQKVRETKQTLLDYKKLVDGYIGAEKDWRVKENSTVTLSVGGLILSNSGAITANYWLTEVYDQEIADAHRKCFLHLHDLSMLTGYCAGWSLKQLLQEGLGGVTGRITSSPANHLSTLCNQMVNFLGIMQNEWAGAQAFSSFDTYLAPFVRADNLDYREVKQCIQSFVYGVNTPSRWGTQAPFTNITLDWTVPEDMANLPAIVGGKEMDFTYGDCQKEMDMVNKAFIEIMIEGDANGRGFQYPIPTYSITKDFDWSDTENNRLLFEMTAKYGTPYFSNYVNSDMKPSDVRSMCCRLRLDLRELRKKGGGYFGSGESTGSIGVVTLNLPRMAYLAQNPEEFYAMLDKYMDIAARSLRIKRQVITRLMDEGLYPYTKRYLGTFENHFSTIGLVGMNEAILNARWLTGDITGQAGHSFAIEVLQHMRTRLSDYQEKYGDLYNLEATPAESTTYRFAKHDVEEFPNIITAAKEGEAPYYTNSTHLPVGYTDDIFDALELEDDMQTLYTSGTVFHGFLGEELPDWKSAAALVRKISQNFRLPYYTLSPTYSVCTTHGYIAGKHFTCPYCGKEAEVYSRITGYYRPVRNWNDGKISEFRNRRTYSERKMQRPVKSLAQREAEARLTAQKAQVRADRQKQTGAQIPPDAQVRADRQTSGNSPEYTPEQIAPNADFISAAMSSGPASAAGTDGLVSAAADKDPAPAAGKYSEGSPQYVLLATKTCPNCRAAEKAMDRAGIPYRVVYAEDAEGAGLAERYNVTSAPTLFVPGPADNAETLVYEDTHADTYAGSDTNVNEDAYVLYTGLGNILGYIRQPALSD